jgi:hypothetical protein
MKILHLILGFVWFIIVVAIALYFACTLSKYHDRDDSF